MTVITLPQLVRLSETGDCLLWQGNGLISQVIRIWTQYSHASLVVKLAECGDRPYLVEAVLPEVEYRDCVQKIRGYDGKVYLHKPKWISRRMRDCIAKKAMEIVAAGVPYDLKSLVKNAIRRVSLDAHAYFCSELVWDLYCQCGVVHKTQTAPRPGDIPRLLRGDMYEITV